MQIYLARNNVQAGPYTLEQLNTMLMSGEVILDDLMWHEGMVQWQRLGDVTANQYHYQPAINSSQAPIPPNNTISSTANTHDSNADTQQVSVDRLYARPTDAKNTSAEQVTENTKNKKSPSHSSVSLSKSSAQSAQTLTNAQNQSVTLAPLMSRILALAINGVLYLLSILPIGLALARMHIDLTKFQNMADFETAYQYSLTLVESIPSSTLMMSQLMILGLFAIQLLLIIRRGQSLGKMMVGIRVVDQTSYRLPSLGHLLGIRTLLLLVIYNILFSVANILGFVAIIANYIMAAKSTKKIGWHDKLAKTLVVKAQDNQLHKDTPK